ncbi:hypothetical protein LVJ94_32240 [Pendulispora rubella]|uniref:Porin n=1 Tax=Pendulispora rubella TaxID=2741070 RepID=A0ABZ2KST1_9BACT
MRGSLRACSVAALVAILRPGVAGAADDRTAVAVAGPSGFGLQSADGAYRLNLRWLLQTDFQAFLIDRPPGVNASSSFVVHFAAVQMSAVMAGGVRAQLFVDFAQGRVTLLDAWAEVDLAKRMTLRVGKFLYPISEERLTPGIWLPFVSTTLASVLLPSRNTGIQLYGEAIPGVLKYNVALTDGVTARIFARPFSESVVAPLAKLGMGVGASYAHRSGLLASPDLPVLRTYGGRTFFAYDDGAAADGGSWRVVPHLTWAWGPVAAYADWVHAADHVGGAPISYDAYGVVASAVLTGEDAEPLSYIVPKHPFDPSNGHFGTFLLVGGVGRLAIGANAFRPGAANPAAASRTATVYGGGFNWYPVSGIAVLSSFGHMFFESAGDAPVRPDENVLIVRLQVAL